MEIFSPYFPVGLSLLVTQHKLLTTADFAVTGIQQSVWGVSTPVWYILCGRLPGAGQDAGVRGQDDHLGSADLQGHWYR